MKVLMVILSDVNQHTMKELKRCTKHELFGCLVLYHLVIYDKTYNLGRGCIHNSNNFKGKTTKTTHSDLQWVLQLKPIVGLKIESELVRFNYIASCISILHFHFRGGD